MLSQIGYFSEDSKFGRFHILVCQKDRLFKDLRIQSNNTLYAISSHRKTSKIYLSSPAPENTLLHTVNLESKVISQVNYPINADNLLYVEDNFIYHNIFPGTLHAFSRRSSLEHQIPMAIPLGSAMRDIFEVSFIDQSTILTRGRVHQNSSGRKKYLSFDSIHISEILSRNLVMRKDISSNFRTDTLADDRIGIWGITAIPQGNQGNIQSSIRLLGSQEEASSMPSWSGFPTSASIMSGAPRIAVMSRPSYRHDVSHLENLMQASRPKIVLLDLSAKSIVASIDMREHVERAFLKINANECPDESNKN